MDDWTEFQALVKFQRGRVVNGAEWRGRKKKVQAVCSAGHMVTPTGGSILAGQGMCRWCPPVQTVVYLVGGKGAIKVGIGSVRGAPRIRLHAREHGLTTVHRLYVGLPPGKAAKAETACLIEVARAGLLPVWGVEFFPENALPLVLKVLDHNGIDEYAADVDVS